MKTLVGFLLTSGNYLLKGAVFQFAINTLLPYIGVPVNLDYFTALSYFIFMDILLSLNNQYIPLKMSQLKVKNSEEDKDEVISIPVGKICMTLLTWGVLFVISLVL